MTRDRIRTAFRFSLVGLLIAISYLAFTPQHFPIIERVWDKLNHATAFVALALAADFSFPDQPYGIRKMLPLLGYGLLIEIVQRYLPYRTFEWWDLFADAVGLLIYGLSLPVLRRLPVLRERWSP